MSYEPKTYQHIRCGICGIFWPEHDPACSGHRYRPPQPPTDTERLDFIFRCEDLWINGSQEVMFMNGIKISLHKDNPRAVVDELIAKEGK